MKDCVLWVGPHVGTGQECDKEGMAEKKCCEPATTSTPYPPALLSRQEVEDLGVKLSLGRKEVGRRWFYFYFCFSLYF